MRNDEEADMSNPGRPVISHVALTVTDLDASIAWYQRVFDIKQMMEEEHEGGIGKLLTDDQFSLVFVLHHHDDNQSEGFAETRTGLDHVGLNVSSRADLDAWQAHLEANGVERVAVADKPLTQSPIAERPYGSVLVFRDPDNIQLELMAPAGT
jgi:catechol 2,3-dioxygenase-like lactoylglutathione lyase family enzyme